MFVLWQTADASSAETVHVPRVQSLKQKRREPGGALEHPASLVLLIFACLPGSWPQSNLLSIVVVVRMLRNVPEVK